MTKTDIVKVARIINPYAYEGPGDPSSPTEREIWKEHGQRLRQEAEAKARKIRNMLNGAESS